MANRRTNRKKRKSANTREKQRHAQWVADHTRPMMLKLPGDAGLFTGI